MRLIAIELLALLVCVASLVSLNCKIFGARTVSYFMFMQCQHK